MITIREYKKKKEQQKEQKKLMNSMEAYQNKLKLHSRKVRIGIVLLVILLTGGGFGTWYYLNNRQYSSVKTIASYERSDAAGTQFCDYDGKVLKYSTDGISCINSSNTVLWNQTYVMQEPVVDVCGSYVAVGDRNGNQVYIFNESGLQGQIETLQPIQKVRVANQGVAAVLVEDTDSTSIVIYDKLGTKLVEHKISMEKKGYPIDFSLSPDGKMLAVSYCLVEKGVITSYESFYNYDSVGQDEIDHLVSAYPYENVITPTIKFINQTTAVSFGNTTISVFSGSQKPKLVRDIPVKEKIKSVFHDENHFGYISQNESTEQSYVLRLYNTKGENILKLKFSLDYSAVKLQHDKILIYNENSCIIYRLDGKVLLKTTFEYKITDMVSTGSDTEYIILKENGTDVIKLK